MSSAFLREWEKWEINSGPWLEVTCSRTPCLENTCIMNSIARSSEVQWMVVRMNMPCLESQSTITRIELQLEDVGRVSMKSIEMDVQGSEVASVNCKVYASGVWLAYKLYKIYNIS